jgi:hypothetical protein
MKAAQKNTPAPKLATQKTAPKASAKISSGDFLTSVDNFLGRRKSFLSWLPLILTGVFGLMLFDGRMSFATDDSTYLHNAVSFLQNGTFPTFQGALYPIVLSIVIAVAGYKLLLLKLCSLIFLLIQVIIYYRAFRDRIPQFILFCGLFVVPFNAYILAYASSTFTECFFMLMQAICFWAFFRLIDRLSTVDNSLKNTWQHWLLFGFTFFLLSITKNVTIFAPGIVVLFFLLRKEWKYALFAIVAFLLFRGPYEVGGRAIFGNISSSQSERLMQRDAFDASQGKADAGDFVDRFFGNFGQYVSLHTFKLMGLRESGVPSLYTIEKVKETEERYKKAGKELMQETSKQPTSDEIKEAEYESRHSWGYTLMFLVLIGLALYHSYRSNKYLFFTLLYVGGISCLTFVAIQTSWNQDRYMVVFLPMIFSLLLYGLYMQGRVPKWKALQPIVVLLGVIVLLIQLGTTFSTGNKNMRYAKKHLGGDLYAGLIPLHQNYAKMAAYVGNNIPDSVKTLASKPEEAFAYSGKLQFTRVPSKTDNADSLIAFFRKSNTQYMIVSVPSGMVADPLYKTYVVAQTLQKTSPAALQQLSVEGQVDQAVIFKLLNK